MNNKLNDTCLSFNTSYGWLTLYASSKGLKEVRFGKLCKGRYGAPDPHKSLNVNLEIVKSDILKYLQGTPVIFDYPMDVSFTTSQTNVFNKLNQILYGTTISYKELADCVGTLRSNLSPRACGSVLASNPLPIIIPCHRVICANGELGGYAGGLHWKIALLKLENSNLFFKKLKS
ncbi:MAG: MGMT family protein [Candidatus Stahlbacteria bacterium]|nr:MGMT family protein [Candidatus Stahlbacteria bacterium]